MQFPEKKIEAMIYTIRGQKVMLDSDLAKLYGVETKVLNQAVKRNIKRFPDDFMIEPNSNELTDLRSQIVTLGDLNTENQVFKFTPKLFTENGVAMLSGLLNSSRAIQVNISIMRTFTKLRSFLAMQSSLKVEVDHLKKETNNLFKIVFEKLDDLDNKLPVHPKNRKKIGLKGSTNH